MTEVKNINEIKPNKKTYKILNCSLKELKKFLIEDDHKNKEAIKIVNRQIKNIKNDNQITKEEEQHFLNRNIVPFIWLENSNYTFEW